MTPRPTYQVSLVRPADARLELLRLWSDNLQMVTDAGAKFDWLYRDAPIVPDDVFLLRADAVAVGTAGVGRRRFQLGAGAGALPDATAGVLADLAVDKAHRSVGPALALVREVKTFALSRHELAYGFPNAQAEGVFKRVGFRRLGQMTRWVRVLRHAGYAERVRELELARVPPAARELLFRVAEQPWLAAVAGTAIDMAQLARRSPSAVEASRRLRVASGPTLDAAALDGLWARARDEHDVIAHRTASVLAWRYAPVATRTWYGAYARSGGELRAYAIVERDAGTSHVKDLFGHRRAMIGLLDLLPAIEYRTGATALSMRYLGAPWLTEALAARGFSERPGGRTIVVGTGEALGAEMVERIGDVGRWHLTDFDEDA